MLTADLSVNGAATGVALPGTAGATTFALLSIADGKAVRRVASSANTTPQVLTIAHSESGTGFKRTINTLIRNEFTKIDSDIADTGGVTPAASIQVTIRRPVQSGGAITTTVLKDLIGQLVAVLTASGNLDKLLNQEQ